jgi:hypothetical protein
LKAVIASIVLALLLTSSPVWAQPSIKQQPIEFKEGQTAATIKGSLKGDQIVDYTLRASAGQAMVVRFKPSNPSAYFNVLPPGSEEAIHIGSSAGNDFSANLPASGEYRVRVYLMRNAARRNESVNYTLEVAVSRVPKKTGAAPAAATGTATAGNGHGDAPIGGGRALRSIPGGSIHQV